MAANLPFPPALLEMLAQQIRSGQLQTPVRTPPPPPVDLDPEEAKRQALAAVASSRSEIAELIDQCNRQSEQGVLSVGQELTAIVFISESYIQEVRDSLSSVQGSGSGEKEGIVEAIAAQSESMHAFMTTVSESASRQSEASQQALEQAQTIIRVGTSINEVARSSKMLALNASIEAARLGNAGRSFAVIANQMQALSERVQESNQLVGDLAGKLQKLLPQIVADASTLQDQSARFESEFTEHLSRVQEDSKNLEQAFEAVLSGGDNRIAAILRHSQEALSNLQFQDPTAQRLMRVDANLAQLEARQQALLTGKVDYSAIEAPLKQEVGGGFDHEDTPESGEVLLF